VPPTTCYQIRRPSFLTRPSPIFKYAWAITPSSLSWVARRLLSPSMVSVFSSKTPLQVPGLVVPLYSLRAHLTQRGCAFYGTYKAGLLVCFPTFVLTVDTSSNCQLSYEPLGRCAPLEILHYVQPRCPPTLYPSELASPTPSSCTATHVPRPAPAVIKDESAVSSLEVRDPSLSAPRPDHPNGAVLPSTQPHQNTMDRPSNNPTLDLSAISSQLLLLAEASQNRKRLVLNYLSELKNTT
jgi:hypothetical protein